MPYLPADTLITLLSCCERVNTVRKKKCQATDLSAMPSSGVVLLLFLVRALLLEASYYIEEN